MEITEVRVSLRDEGRLKAYVAITIDGCFVVRGLRVIDGPRGLFVAMPSRRKPNGGYEDIAHPIDTDTRAMLERIILQAYLDSESDSTGEGAPPPEPPPMPLLH